VKDVPEAGGEATYHSAGLGSSSRPHHGGFGSPPRSEGAVTRDPRPAPRPGAPLGRPATAG
jgi:hypothetical protein